MTAPPQVRAALVAAIRRSYRAVQRGQDKRKNRPDHGGSSAADAGAILRLRAGVFGGLCGVAGCAWTSAHFLQSSAEQVWLGERGPLGKNRDIAFLPYLTCIGTSMVAAAAAAARPRLAMYIYVPGKIHEILGLPLTILLAFRFQDAYDRWWSSRKNVEEMASCMLSLATTASHSLPAHGNLFTLADEMTEEKMLETAALRARFFALAEAYLLYAERLIHGSEYFLGEGHPDEHGVSLPRLQDTLGDWPQDLAACEASLDPTLWCMSGMQAIVLRLEQMGAVTGDWASVTYNSLNTILRNYGFCMAVNNQYAPDGFIIHLRSMLMVYCLTFPFSIVKYVRPVYVVVVQSIVTFAFLGTEFCSREMEHPFGKDKGDIPVRVVFKACIDRLHQVRDQSL